MKFFTGLSVVAVGLCLAGVGCKNKKPPMSDVSPTVTDLNTSPAPVPTYTPVTPVEPAYTATPTVIPSVTPVMTSTKYTVKKGDTLWKIAATHYGDGKQYTKIIAANPGMAPEKLKAGQTITLP